MTVLDIRVTGTVSVFLAVIAVGLLSMVRRKRWCCVALLGGLSCAATYAVWIGLMPSWSVLTPYAGMGAIVELLLLAGVISLPFIALLIHIPRMSAAGLAGGVIGAVALLAFLEPGSRGWLVASPMPEWAVFWLGLVLVPIAFVIANTEAKLFECCGIGVYIVILALWLSLGPCWEVWVSPLWVEVLM